MARVILTGPLAWPPLLESVAGADLARTAAPVSLPRAGIGPGEACFPLTVPVEDGQIAGLLADPGDPDIFDRLRFFAAATGAAPVPRHVGDAGQGAAVAFLGTAYDEPGPGAWDLQLWADRWGAIALDAAAEIMGYHGTEPPEALHWRMPMILSRAASRQAARAPAPATLRSATPADTVETLDRQTPHAGFFLTRAYALRHPVFGGGMGEVVQREVFVATDAALVLPYDPERDRLLLVEQFRMGPFGRGDPRPFALEPVAGRVDAGETPAATAHRECAEEAALPLRGLEHMTSHYCSPGCTTEVFHCYLGLADLPRAGAGHGGLETEHEDIRTHVVSFDRAMALLESGEVNVGPLVLMLLWLARERPRLRGTA
jgi:nudix-type nucleoside diphosphatase (YffH/AdpP family)